VRLRPVHLERRMKISLVAGEPKWEACNRLRGATAEHLRGARQGRNCGNWIIWVRQVHFGPRETVFAQEQMTTSFYNLLAGVMRLYKLLHDGRRQNRGIVAGEIGSSSERTMCVLSLAQFANRHSFMRRREMRLILDKLREGSSGEPADRNRSDRVGEKL